MHGVEEVVINKEVVAGSGAPVNVFLHNRCDAARAAGESPCHTQLRIRADTIEPLHDGLKTWRSICEENRRFQTQLLQHPGRLRIESAGAGSDGIHSIPFMQ